MLDSHRFLWYKMFINNRLYTIKGGPRVKTGCKEEIEFQGLGGRDIIGTAAIYWFLRGLPHSSALKPSFK